VPKYWGLAGLGLGLALGSVWFSWFVLVLWTIMWHHLLNQCSVSMFVRTENREIQRLISVRMDGYQALIFAIFRL